MGSTVNPTPAKIGGLPVVCYTPSDGRRRPTGRCRHVGPEGEIGPTMGLAVCGRPGEGFYLFRCDRDWRPLADTWHATVDEAMRQAEFEYEGVAATWRHNS
jgi:hypothetical protein